MAAAGFTDVVLQEVSFEHVADDVDAFWDSMSRGSIPMVMLKKKLGPEWEAFSAQARDRFAREVGEGPVAVRWPAILGLGSKPAYT
jgi:hypothetical protein